MTVMMLTAFPGMLNAQKPCHDGVCPVGKICIDNHCVKLPVFCNCLIRPIPPECGQLCGWYTDPNNISNLISITDGNKVEIQLNLEEVDNASFRIYDTTGKLIKTIADAESQSNHDFEWDKTDAGGNSVSPGLYILQLDAGPGYAGTQKRFVVN